MSLPTVDQFAEELIKEPRWYDLGIFLGVPTYELDVIARDYRLEGIQRQLIELFKCFQSHGKLLSWNDIADALTKMQHKDLADQLRHKYIQTVSSSYSPSIGVSQRYITSHEVLGIQFVAELDSVGHQWYDLGIFLGISTSELARIKQSHEYKGFQRCLIELFKCFQSRTKPVSWNDIIEALTKMNNNDLADRIREKTASSSYPLSLLHSGSVSEPMETDDHEISSKLKRRREGQKIGEFKKEQEDRENQNWLKERQKEKDEQLRARQEVLAKLEQDKQERLAQKKKTSVTTTTTTDTELRSRSSSVTSSPVTTVPSVFSAVRSSSCRIQVKLPDGRSTVLLLSATDTVGILRDKIAEYIQVERQQISITCIYPRKELGFDLDDTNLDQHGLVPSGVILARTKTRKREASISEKREKQNESDRQLFVQECRKGRIEIHPLKCILSGLPRVGKTSFMYRLQGKKPLVKCPSTGLECPVSISILERTNFTTSLVNKSGNWIHTSNVLEEGYLLLQQVKASSHLLQQVKTSSSGEATTHISDNRSDLIISSDRFSTSIENVPSTEPSGLSDTPNSMEIEENVLNPAHEFLSDVLNKPSVVQEILKNSKESKTVYFMDTGGQPEFHELLPPILHGPALHLIFFNASLKLNEPVKVNFCHTETEIESVQYTANSSSIDIIHQLLSTLYSLHIQEKSRQSKAVVLGSHIDLLGEDESQRRYKINEISHLLKQYIETTDYYENAFLTFPNDSDSIFLPIDNKTASDEEMEDIKKFLEHVFDDFEPVPLPITWAAFHLILRYKYKSGVCTIEECTDLAVKCGIKSEDVVSVLRYLHNNVGTILYYEEVDDLNKLVICDPNVLFQQISHLVAVSFAGRGKVRNIAEKIRKSGKVPLHVVNKAKSPDPNSPLKVSHLIKLLTHYKLMKEVEQDGDIAYFMPCLLRPEEMLESSISGDKVSRLDCPPLLIMFKGGYIPVGIFSAIIIELSSEWEIDDSKPLYRNHVDFIARSHRVELRSCYTFLEIRITAHDEASSYCYHTRKVFNQCLSNVLQVHHHTAHVEVFEGFYCPGSFSCQSRHMWKCKNGFLMCSGQERCRGYNSPFPLCKLSSVERSWFEENPSISEQISPMKVHTHESSLPQPKYECDSLTGSDIPDVLEAIVSEPNWFMLGLALRVRHNILDEIKDNCKKIQDCRYEMLREWISSGKATWNELVNALCCSIVNNKQLAEEIETKYMKVKKSV